MIKRRIWLFAIGMMTIGVWGQTAQGNEDDQRSLDQGSLESQYDYLINKSNDYQEYKVIRKTWVAKFEKSLKDTLAAQEQEKNETAELAASQNTIIEELKNDLTTTRDSLRITQEEKGNMAWLGISMEKRMYRILMWSIIGVLTFAVLILLLMFKSNNAITRDTKEKFNDLDEEFTEYKRRSLEREQKLRRELQDEINKQKLQK